MISEKRVQDVLELAGEEEKVRIGLLYRQWEKRLKACDQKSTTENIKAWNRSEKELADYLDQVEGDRSDDTATAPAAAFQNLARVLDYLKHNGWKVSSSTIYKHKGQGLIRPGVDGKFTLDIVRKYAADNLERLDGSTVREDENTDRKREAEIRKIEAQAEHWENKARVESGLYVPRENFERELAARAKVLKNDHLMFNRAQAADIVSLVGGDPEKVPDLIQFMNDAALDFYHRYSADPDPGALE